MKPSSLFFKSPSSKISFFLLFIFAFSSAVDAKEFLVNDQAQFNKALGKLKPGDELVMANGVWKDFDILFEAKGTEKEPIILRPQEKGKVIISGESALRIAGEHLEIRGLVFKDGYTPRDTVIAFRKSKPKDADDNGVLANNTRLTEVVIDNYSNPERYETDFWVLLYGKNNRVDHSHFSGKKNKGVLMAVRLDTEGSRENRHLIDHNYFGPRSILGSNGGETLRVGTSHYSLSDSFTRVEYNFFDRCDGELEIISSKSGGNVYKGNTFYESRGTMTLRHGNGNLIEENVFLGNGADHTGGIRVINERQTVKNNYIEGLAGYRFGGALVVMNGVPNSPINRYHQVKDSVIENNILINSDHIQLAAGSDAERSAVPITTTFKNNVIYHDNSKNTITVYDDISGISFDGNVQHGDHNSEIKEGFVNENIVLEKADNGLKYPKNIGSVGVKPDLVYAQRENVGVSWYEKTDNRIEFDTGRKIKVKPGLDTLTEAVKKANAGDILTLAPGDYSVSRVLVLDKPLTFQAKNPKKAVNISFSKKSLFEVVDGGSIKLKGLSITGANAPDDIDNSVIRSSKYSMLINYKIEVEDCSFKDLDVNKWFNFIKTSKGTFADDIKISGSRFENVSGSILKLDAETDDFGMYNSEYVRIKDSEFISIGGSITDYYRGGTDESTFGPHFYMTGSTLENVGNSKKNKSAASILLHGVQVSTVKDNVFKNSAPIKINHTVGEPVTKVVDNTMSSSSLPVVKELNSEKENTATIRDNKIDG